MFGQGSAAFSSNIIFSGNCKPHYTQAVIEHWWSCSLLPQSAKLKFWLTCVLSVNFCSKDWSGFKPPLSVQLSRWPDSYYDILKCNIKHDLVISHWFVCTSNKSSRHMLGFLYNSDIAFMLICGLTNMFLYDSKIVKEKLKKIEKHILAVTFWSKPMISHANSSCIIFHCFNLLSIWAANIAMVTHFLSPESSLCWREGIWWIGKYTSEWIGHLAVFWTWSVFVVGSQSLAELQSVLEVAKGVFPL